MQTAKIDKELQFWEIKKAIGYPLWLSTFAKCGLINYKEFTSEDYRKFVLRVARHSLLNVIEEFLFGVWSPGTDKLVRIPVKKKLIGHKYILWKRDQKYFSQLCQRIDWKAQAEIVTDGVLNDNCQLHARPKGWWEKHWLNPKNNKGYPLVETGERVLPHWERRAWYWWHRYDHPWKPDMTPEDLEEMKRYQATRDYLKEEIYGWLVPELKSRFGKMVIFHNNEVTSYLNWHRAIKDILIGHGIKGRVRRVSSLLALDYYRDKSAIWNWWIQEIHGINSLHTYEWAKEKIAYDGVKLLCSEDGGGWWTKAPPGPERQKQLKDRRMLIRKIFEDGNYGFTFNLWLYESCNFADLDWTVLNIFRNEALRFLGKADKIIDVNWEASDQDLIFTGRRDRGTASDY